MNVVEAAEPMDDPVHRQAFGADETLLFEGRGQLCFAFVELLVDDQPGLAIARDLFDRTVERAG